jgi:hypothetical protein
MFENMDTKYSCPRWKETGFVRLSVLKKYSVTVTCGYIVSHFRKSE